MINAPVSLPLSIRLGAQVEAKRCLVHHDIGAALVL